MSHPTLKVGIIGLGVGESHIAGYNLSESCKVIALCDFDKQKLFEVGARHPGIRLFDDAASILNDPTINVVSIATFDTFHYEQIITAIKNGKHVFVEKPLCLFQHELDGIKKALNKNPHIRLSSNLILRCTSRFKELRRRIMNDDLGRLYYIEGDYDYGRIHKLTEGWRGKIPYYSVIHGGAIHLIDLILWLSEQYPEEVFAYGNRISSEGTTFRHNDFVAALLKFESGLVAKISANFASVTIHGHKLCIYGTKGTFIHGHNDAFYYKSRDPDAIPELVNDIYPDANKGDMIPSFIRYILHGERPLITAKEVLEAMAVSLSVEQSVLKHRPIKLKL